MTDSLAKAKPTRPLNFFVAQNEGGGWVVREPGTLREHKFASSREALRFALFELGDRPACALLTPRLAKKSSWYSD